MGLECASPGIGVRHRMFSPVVGLQRSGKCCPSALPEASGPRNDGHGPAELPAGANAFFAGPPVCTIVRTGGEETKPAGIHWLRSMIIRRGSQHVRHQGKAHAGAINRKGVSPGLRARFWSGLILQRHTVAIHRPCSGHRRPAGPFKRESARRIELHDERAHRQRCRRQGQLSGSRTGNRADHDCDREHRSIRFSFLVFHYFGAQNGSPAFTS